jgi:hypothetical protein
VIPQIVAIWPIAKWVLQALGFLGPEDKEAEREFHLRLMAAQEANRQALTEAFAAFQSLWRPPADRVYVWANTAIALFQPAIVGLVYYDMIFGSQRSIAMAQSLAAAGVPGLLVMAILLFPLYGPALVSSVSSAFGGVVELAMRRQNGAGRSAAASAKEGSSVSAEVVRSVPSSLRAAGGSAWDAARVEFPEYIHVPAEDGPGVGER